MGEVGEVSLVSKTNFELLGDNWLIFLHVTISHGTRRTSAVQGICIKMARSEITWRDRQTCSLGKSSLKAENQKKNGDRTWKKKWMHQVLTVTTWPVACPCQGFAS